MPRMMPGVIPPGIHTTPASNGLDMSGIPGFDVVQRLLMKFGLDPSLLGEWSRNFACLSCGG